MYIQHISNIIYIYFLRDEVGRFREMIFKIITLHSIENKRNMRFVGITNVVIREKSKNGYLYYAVLILTSMTESGHV